MNQLSSDRKQLLKLLQDRLSVSPDRLVLVLNTWTDFQISFLIRYFSIRNTDNLCDFRAWVKDQVLLKEGTLEALERQYYILQNTLRETVYRSQQNYLPSILRNFNHE